MHKHLMEIKRWFGDYEPFVVEAKNKANALVKAKEYADKTAPYCWDGYNKNDIRYVKDLNKRETKHTKKIVKRTLTVVAGVFCLAMLIVCYRTFFYTMNYVSAVLGVAATCGYWACMQSIFSWQKDFCWYCAICKVYKGNSVKTLECFVYSYGEFLTHCKVKRILEEENHGAVVSVESIRKVFDDEIFTREVTT